jgi:NhaP-type Na+/H+ or K+/H+ antiporter
MDSPVKLPVAALLLTVPLSALAQGAPHTGAFLYSFGGGLLGGALGAFLACWFCHRRHDRRDNGDTKKY